MRAGRTGNNDKMNLKRKGREYRSTWAQIQWHRVKAGCGRVIFFRSIKQNRNTRILVILHLYYMEAWPSIKRYLENLSPYRYDLVVTYITGHYDSAVLEQIRSFKKDALFAEYENKGFDIGAFIDILSKTDLHDYDIVFKLHSKGVGRDFIYIYDQVFKKADWFLNLFDGILGEINVHRVVRRLMQKPDIGLVASKNLIVKDPPHKKAFTCSSAAQLHVPINESYHFVAGSCFAIKAPLLSCIQDLNLTINSFESTKRGYFSIAHALERIVCACIEPQGQRLFGISVRHPRYWIERRYQWSISALRLLEDDRFSIDYDYFYKALEMYPVFSYEIKSMRLGDLRRYWNGSFYPLKDCAPFAYLFGEMDRYNHYADENAKKSSFEMSSGRFDDLIKSMEENGFDPTYLPIVCALDNTIWDGLHRCCWLQAKFGEDYVIPVVYLHSNVWYPTSNPGIRLNVRDKLKRALMPRAFVAPLRSI